MNGIDYSRMFNPDGLLVPKVVDTEDLFCAAPRFVAPDEVLCDSLITPIENQGTKPWCAAYSATTFAESALWRVKGYPEQIDPQPVYEYAKSIDGHPTVNGTYLECAMQALVHLGYFDGRICKVKTIGGRGLCCGDALIQVKYAIFRYGCCVGGFNITDEWFSPEKAVIRGKDCAMRGGHAVTLCGYDRNGVIVANSWGRGYGRDGKVYVTNEAFRRQFSYGCVLTHCLDGIE